MCQRSLIQHVTARVHLCRDRCAVCLFVILALVASTIGDVPSVGEQSSRGLSTTEGTKALQSVAVRT